MAIMLGALITGLIGLVVGLLAMRWGVDSRLPDVDRATPWWPANPRD
jgi:hypothetical protein